MLLLQCGSESPDVFRMVAQRLDFQYAIHMSALTQSGKTLSASRGGYYFDCRGLHYDAEPQPKPVSTAKTPRTARLGNNGRVSSPDRSGRDETCGGRVRLEASRPRTANNARRGEWTASTARKIFAKKRMFQNCSTYVIFQGTPPYPVKRQTGMGHADDHTRRRSPFVPAMNRHSPPRPKRKDARGRSINLPLVQRAVYRGKS